ncbi:MAG: ABC1 kinase family protein [Eubacteriaceae bacterium]|jgi:ubiquinone biosynthesis protein
MASGEQQTTTITRAYRRRRLHEIISILSKYDITHGITPDKLVSVIEALGPTYIKLGQIMAMRQDILPPDYCKALLKLQENVNPLPFADILSVLETEYRRNPAQIFSSIDPEPLGSASIAQVHRAVLKSTGEDVVLKVQRPHIYEKMAEDVSLMERAARIMNIVTRTTDVIDFRMVIREMWAAAQKEMDFLIEARNCEYFFQLNEEVAYITSPVVFREYTTSKILVMNYIGGFEISRKEDIRKAGYDLNDIAIKLCNNYMKQVLTDGFFQADPHQGNIRIWGGKIAWLDMGMMGNLSHRDRSLLSQALEAVATGNVESLKAAFLMLGEQNGRIDHSALYIDISDMLDEYSTMEISDIDLARFMDQMLTICSKNHIEMPPGITMLVRGMITIEGVILDIAPDVSPIQVFVSYVGHEEFQDFDMKVAGKKLLRSLLAAGASGLEVPVTFQELLSSTLKGQAKINIALTGSEEPLSAISRMVNKIVMCIVLAAGIIGSSFIATTDMTPKILNIPALGVLGYLICFILGMVIVIDMYSQQRKLDGKK